MKDTKFYIKTGLLLLAILCLGVIVYFEEPRLSMALSLVFKERVKGIAYFLPFLALSAYILDSGKAYGKAVIFFVGVLMFCSYVDSIMRSIDKSETDIILQTDKRRQDLKIEESKLEAIKDAPKCYLPKKANYSDSSEYEIALIDYRSCLSRQKTQSDKIEKKRASLELSIEEIKKDISSLSLKKPDYSAAWMEAVQGVFLTLAFSVGSGLLCKYILQNGPSIVEEFIYISEISEDEKIKIAIMQNPKASIRELSKLSKIPKSTIYRKIKLLKKTPVPQWDSVGQSWDKMGQRGTELGQAEIIEIQEAVNV